VRLLKIHSAMFSIFTTRNNGYCDFDSIAFFEKKEFIRAFSGELMISIRNDDPISNIFSEDGNCHLDDLLYGVSNISMCLESEDAFSFTFDGITRHEVKNGDDFLTVSSELKYKTVNKHTFIFILKIILSEINIFTSRAKNKNYEDFFRGDRFLYILNY